MRSSLLPLLFLPLVCVLFRVGGCISVQGTVDIREPGADLSVARVSLDGGRHRTLVGPSGSFAVHGLKGGRHLLEVLHPDFVFSPLAVEVDDVDASTRIYIWSLEHGQGPLVKHPLVIEPLGRAEFFQPRESIAAWALSLLKNPMAILALVSIGGLMVMPKLQQNIDPEDLRQFTGNQPNYESSFISALPSAEERR